MSFSFDYGMCKRFSSSYRVLIKYCDFSEYLKIYSCLCSYTVYIVLKSAEP